MMVGGMPADREGPGNRGRYNAATLDCTGPPRPRDPARPRPRPCARPDARQLRARGQRRGARRGAGAARAGGGPPGSGRSHLLQGLLGAAPAAAARLLGPGSPEADFVHDPSVRLWLLDDCDALDAARQVAAFHLFNAVQAHAEAALASAGARPPAQLPAIPELATRLGWGLVLQLRPLSDADTARALERTLAERGVAASADLVPWLLTHAPRDMGSLRALVDALDAFALARKRAITLPLLREFAQGGLPFETGGGPRDLP
jgi:DnaA family protein